MALVPPRDPSQWDEWQKKVNDQHPFEMRRMPAAAKSAGTRTIIPRVPVIMVNFANYEFVATKADVDSMFNGQNWTKDDATGSVRQYFHDQSNGSYNPKFDIFGPITLSHNYGYYSYIGKGSVGYMVTEACAMVDDEVDFADYDSDGDGKVDLVYIFYAGYGQNDDYYIRKKGLVPETDSLVFPAYWNIYSAGYGTNKNVFDGKKIYACEYSNELDGYYSTIDTKVVAGIGVPCHEYCHALGLPDLYATVNRVHKLLGSWDIMCYGPYNNGAHTPPSLSAYERFFLGWLTPTLITEPDTLTLEHIATSNKAYLIAENDKHNLDGLNPDSTVFFLLENRQLASWDIGVPGSGMMLTRIHFQPALWSGNTVNNDPNNLGVDLIEADGLTPSTNTEDGYIGKAGDLFPEGATEYTGIPNHAITDIVMSDDGIIRFVYRGGKTPTPVDVVKDESVADESAHKTIRNGQMMIERNGVYYNILGNKLH